MGKVVFKPESGEEYLAKVDGYPDLEIHLPPATDGVRLSVAPFTDDSCSVFIHLKDPTAQKTDFYIALSSRGITSKVLKIKTTNHITKLQIPFEDFTHGINQITLADSVFRPLAERLVFIKKDQPLSIEIATNKGSYTKRDKVEVEISATQNSMPVVSNLSVSVVNNKQVGILEKYPQNIYSYLLLDSELKGNIENPSYYFKDDSMSTSMKLDLLMLTHGWRKYTWNNLAEKLPAIEFEKEEGIIVKGKVKKLLGKKGVDDGKISLLVINDSNIQELAETTSDKEGNFSFPPTAFMDPSEVFIQGANKHNRLNTKLQHISSFPPPAPVHIESISDIIFEPKKEKEFTNMAYVRQLDDRVYNPGKHEIMIPEVTVTERINYKDELNDGHWRLYSHFDNIIKVDEHLEMCPDVISLVQGRVAGVFVKNGHIIFRRFGGEVVPLYLIDGTPADAAAINELSVSDIEKIEIIKSPLVVYGGRGQNGAVAIYTKRGIDIYKEPHYKGILSCTLRGYQESREFYSPNYEDHNSQEKPDHRTTIYWNPIVATDSTGAAGFSFYTTDDYAPALIKIEGITNTGMPGVAYKEFFMGADIEDKSH